MEQPVGTVHSKDDSNTSKHPPLSTRTDSVFKLKEETTTSNVPQRVSKVKSQLLEATSGTHSTQGELKGHQEHHHAIAQGNARQINGSISLSTEALHYYTIYPSPSRHHHETRNPTATTGNPKDTDGSSILAGPVGSDPTEMTKTVEFEQAFESLAAINRLVAVDSPPPILRRCPAPANTSLKDLNVHYLHTHNINFRLHWSMGIGLVLGVVVLYGVHSYNGGLC